MKSFPAPDNFFHRALNQFGSRIAVCLLMIWLALVSINLQQTTRAAAGDLDLTFGNGGKVSADLFGEVEVANACALQSNGKIVIAGSTAPLANSTNRGEFALARFNSDGTLDATFGNGGKVSTDFDVTHKDQANAVAVQSDGKIIAAGFTSFSGSDDNTDSAFALARYNADGTLDSSFGNGGKVVTNLSNPIGFNTYYRESINALAIQSDGKIVATGTAFLNFTQSMDFTTVRYNTDGSLDSSFGQDGKVFTNFTNSTPSEPNDSAGEIFIQNDGKIIVAGRVHHLAFDCGIARYNGDGSLDSTFGQGGQIATNLVRQNSGNLGKETAMTVAANGKIILGGFTQTDGGNHFALARFEANGNPDATFGNAGQATTNLSGAIRSLKVQSDGKIIAAGESPNGAGDFALVQFNNDGTLDATFGNGGQITTDFFGRADKLNALLIQQDGKLLAIGTATNSAENADFAIVRYSQENAQPITKYDLCVQDESSKNYLEINSMTGEYLLTRCDFKWLVGTGAMTKDSSTLTLTDEATDRMVQVSVNLIKRKAQITIRTFAPKVTTKIKDKNIDNNSCSCN